MKRAFEIIDTMNGRRVVAGPFPTHRRALNATRKMEPEPTVPKTYRSAFTGRLAMDWRFQIRPAAQ